MKLVPWLFTLSLIGCSRVTMIQTQVPRSAKSVYPYAQVEPEVAWHPTDSLTIAAGSVLNDFYLSHDGGKTYTADILTSPYGVFGDPVLIYDSAAQLYYFHLASVENGEHLDRIVCQTLSPNNKHFSEGTFPKPVKGKVQDKHWAAYDVQRNRIHLTWTQFDGYKSTHPKDSSVIVHAYSDDNGSSWSAPLRISAFAGDCLDGDSTVEGAYPILTRDGDLLVFWSGPKGIAMQRSKNGGDTWLPKEDLLFPHTGGWDIEIPGFGRANGFPIPTYNPLSGVLTVHWCEQSGKRVRWMSSQSTNKGVSWAPAQTNGLKRSARQFYINASVDPATGVEFATCYVQKRKHSSDTHVYLFARRAPNQKFKRLKLTDRPFSPDEEVFFGDYLGIDAKHGKAVVFYPTMVSGYIRLYSVVVHSADWLK